MLFNVLGPQTKAGREVMIAFVLDSASLGIITYERPTAQRLDDGATKRSAMGISWEAYRSSAIVAE